VSDFLSTSFLEYTKSFPLVAVEDM